MNSFARIVRESAVMVLVACALLVATAIASAQVAVAPGSAMAPAEARLRYEQRLAQCNVGTLAAPDRQACVRSAGQIYDLDRSGQPAPDATTTTDGRATVIRPPAVPPTAPTTGSTTAGVTSADGRATIIAPDVAPQ